MDVPGTQSIALASPDAAQSHGPKPVPSMAQTWLLEHPPGPVHATERPGTHALPVLAASLPEVVASIPWDASARLAAASGDSLRMLTPPHAPASAPAHGTMIQAEELPRAIESRVAPLRHTFHEKLERPCCRCASRWPPLLRARLERTGGTARGGRLAPAADGHLGKTSKQQSIGLRTFGQEREPTPNSTKTALSPPARASSSARRRRSILALLRLTRLGSRYAPEGTEARLEELQPSAKNATRHPLEGSQLPRSLIGASDKKHLDGVAQSLLGILDAGCAGMPCKLSQLLRHSWSQFR